MRPRMLGMLTLCGLLLVCAACSAQEALEGADATRAPDATTQRFAEANRLYVEGDYAGARALYLELVEQGYHTLPVYYNLGNACAQLGDAGLAVLYYRRALLIAPRHADTRFNLAHVTAHLAYQPPLVVRGWGRVLLEWLWGRVSVGELLAAALCLYWLTAVAGAVWLHTRRRRACAVLVVLSVCLLAAAGLAWGQWHAEYASGAAVITNDTRLLSGPGGNFEALAEIGQGAEVRLLQTQGRYHEIRTQGGGRGWVEADDFALISPYAGR